MKSSMAMWSLTQVGLRLRIVRRLSSAATAKNKSKEYQDGNLQIDDKD